MSITLRRGCVIRLPFIVIDGVLVEAVGLFQCEPVSIRTY